MVGHTDVRSRGRRRSIWGVSALGQRRADAVRSYIIEQGYPAQNVAPAKSMGKRDLLPEYPPDSLEQRRVVAHHDERAWP